MGIGKDPPPFDSEAKPFTRYKTEVNTWVLVTEIPKAKWGLVLALSLPEKDKSDIRNKVFDALGEQLLKGEEGFSKLMTFLEKEFGEDEIYDVFNKFEEFESCRKKSDQSMQQYISTFELKYTQVKNKGFPELPQEYLMFKVIKNSGLNENETRLVQTDIDYDKKTKLFDSAKAGLVKYFGRMKEKKTEDVNQKAFALNEGVGDHDTLYGGYRDRSETWGGRGNNRYGNNHGGGNNRYSNNHGGGQSGDFRGGRQGGGQGGGGGFLSSAGFQGRGGFKGNRDQHNRDQGGFQSHGGQGGYNVGGQGNWRHERSGGNKPKKPINPLDQNGQRQLCSSCGSFRHLLQDCKDS